MKSLSLNNKTNPEPSTGGDWDETAAAAPTPSNPTGNAAAAELMDMKALELKRNEQDDIAERMRVEETRAKLAAAREGMEKEAKRLKDEKERKESKKMEKNQAQSGGRFGAAVVGAVSSAGIGGGGKWVPVHMRNSGAAAAPSRTMTGGSRFRAAASATGYQKKVDTADDELFPDLANANKLIQEEEDHKAAVAAAKQARAAKKAKAGAEARRAAEKALEEENQEVEEKEKEELKPVVETKAEEKAEPAKKKKKKKKKDLSSFKPA